MVQDGSTDASELAYTKSKSGDEWTIYLHLSSEESLFTGDRLANMFFHAQATARILSVNKCFGGPGANLDGFQDGSSEGQRIPHEPQQALLSLKLCRNMPLFAAVSHDTLYLWSSRPSVLLATVRRSESTILEDGENFDIIWKPDATALAVVTNKGHLHFYDIRKSASKPLDLQFINVHHFMTGPGEANGMQGLSLHFTLALEIATGIQCGIGRDEEILLCTHNPPSIVSLSWQGDVIIDGTSDLADVDFYDEADSGLVHIVLNEHTGLYGWITALGKAYIAQRSSAARSLRTWLGLCFYNSDRTSAKATCIAMNQLYSMIAVGTTSCRWSEAQIGGVSALDWSTDGQALAVGWSSGGLSLWSMYGRLLMTTFSEELRSSSSEEDDPVVEGYFTGVRDLGWGVGDFDLFVLPKCLHNEDVTGDIYVLPFAKSALVDNFTQARIAWNCLLTFTSIALISDPAHYVALNANGNYIAIAGSRGLAHYSAASNKWKLFGNEQQEQSFRIIGGMHWYRNALITGCEDLETQTYEIRVFSREGNLVLTNVLVNEPLPASVIAMGMTDANLLVYTADNVLRQYLVTSEGTKMSLHARTTLSLNDVVPSPFAVRAVAWCPAGDGQQQSQPSILVLNGGTLHLFKENSEQSWELTQIKTKVEIFWISRPQDRIGNLFNSLWVMDGRKLQMWANVGAGAGPLTAWNPTLEIAPAIQVDVDFYPLNHVMALLPIPLAFSPAVALNKGLVAGIESQIPMASAVNHHLYRADVKTRLFLHVLVRHLLFYGDEAEAGFVTQTYQQLPYWQHSLEVLLHQALEAEAGTGLSPQQAFLRKFTDFPQIVAHTARKSEASLWPYFFSIIGDPKVLFEMCLRDGTLRSATSYLVIVQSLESTSISGQLALDLLERAKALKNTEIRQEVLRFLTSIEGEDGEHFMEILKRKHEI
ncbi:RIC1-domain-containing protein [Fimicolochytrium jonesii]|uniref:RIC1-domain-containing protein n=1 Tax=Fimicolochytrium jonesii TaxID=1396493 RepID=UPI0022FE8F68|nr:RIC1-domain-containing protein [Fimicolochytrium jonesii]KAI8819877.1 RIC1-domain-containing protein [Fimicolochytrium jonesii]